MIAPALRRRLALWLCPELAHKPAVSAPEMARGKLRDPAQVTIDDLLRMIDLLAAATGRSPSTISRLATGSGDTIRRLRAVDGSGRRVYKITTDRVERASQHLSGLWPADLPWPTDIPRPTKKEAA